MRYEEIKPSQHIAHTKELYGDMDDRSHSVELKTKKKLTFSIKNESGNVRLEGLINGKISIPPQTRVFVESIGDGEYAVRSSRFEFTLACNENDLDEYFMMI